MTGNRSTQPMMVFTGIFGAWICIIAVAALFDEPNDSLVWTLIFLAMAIYGSTILVGALRLRFDVTDGTLRYRGYVLSTRVPVSELTGVFTERYDGGVFFFVNGPRFLRVITIQDVSGVRQLDGTAGREKHVARLKAAILAQMPEDHPQRSDLTAGPGGAHRK